MEEELKIRRIQPYPPKGDENGGARRGNRGEREDEEEQEPTSDQRGPEPEVKDGHIDTRVSPR